MLKMTKMKKLNMREQMIQTQDKKNQTKQVSSLAQNGFVN